MDLAHSAPALAHTNVTSPTNKMASPAQPEPRRTVLNLPSFGLAAALMAVWQFPSLMQRGFGWNPVFEFLFFVVSGGVILGVAGLAVWRLVARLWR